MNAGELRLWVHRLRTGWRGDNRARADERGQSRSDAPAFSVRVVLIYGHLAICDAPACLLVTGCFLFKISPFM